jgi:hypothetical protein
MTYFRTLVLAVLCAASLSAAVHAAGVKGSAPADVIRPWLGTWSCAVGAVKLTVTFQPLFGGNAMRISGNAQDATEEIVVWDAKRGKWIDEYADAAGSYNTMEGRQAGNTIRFVQVYPAGDPAFVMTMPSKNTYTSTYTATMNGKTITERETCTRQ